MLQMDTGSGNFVSQVGFPLKFKIAASVIFNVSDETNLKFRLPIFFYFK